MMKSIVWEPESVMQGLLPEDVDVKLDFSATSINNHIANFSWKKSFQKILHIRLYDWILMKSHAKSY